MSDNAEETRVSRRGRRPGPTVGRAQILAAATTQFGTHGYQATTIRRVAEAAGVNTKLVHYYFGTKEELFSTAIAESFRARNILKLLSGHSPGDVGSPGTGALIAILTALEDPGFGSAFVGLVRNLGTHEESRRIFLRLVGEEILGHLPSRLEGGQAETRVALSGSQILGLILARYVLKVPPIATLSIEEVAHIVGPTIDRYLFGEID